MKRLIVYGLLLIICVLLSNQSPSITKRDTIYANDNLRLYTNGRLTQIQPLQATLVSDLSQVPLPAPITPTTPQISSNNCYSSLVSQYNWPVPTMLAIEQAESGCNPNAYNPSGCYGLFQINGYGAVYDPATNIADAYQKYLSQGLSAWTTWSSGAYLQYLQ